MEERTERPLLFGAVEKLPRHVKRAERDVICHVTCGLVSILRGLLGFFRG